MEQSSWKFVHCMKSKGTKKQQFHPLRHPFDFIVFINSIMTPETTIILRKTVKVLLCLSGILETWAGIYLIYDQSHDLVGSFAGFFVTVVGILLVSGSLSDSFPLLALLQVILASFQLVLVILIGLSIYFGMNDNLLIALYFSSLMFMVLQSILLREFLSFYTPSPERQDYQDLDDSVA